MKTMTIIIRFGLLLSAILVLASCDNGLSPAKNLNKNEMAKPLAAPVKLHNDHLNATYQQYRHLESALIEGNITQAKVAALAVETGSRRVQNGTAMAIEAGLIIDAKSIEKQRAAFASLSRELIALTKKTGLDSGKLYVLHCPMALNDQGAYWLSNNKEIRNPYYGKDMLNCGSVKETVN